jgi:hypothetical protein
MFDDVDQTLFAPLGAQQENAIAIYRAAYSVEMAFRSPPER